MVITRMKIQHSDAAWVCRAKSKVWLAACPWLLGGHVSQPLAGSLGCQQHPGACAWVAKGNPVCLPWSERTWAHCEWGAASVQELVVCHGTERSSRL